MSTLVNVIHSLKQLLVVSAVSSQSPSVNLPRCPGECLCKHNRCSSWVSHYSTWHTAFSNAHTDNKWSYGSFKQKRLRVSAINTTVCGSAICSTPNLAVHAESNSQCSSLYFSKPCSGLCSTQAKVGVRHVHVWSVAHRAEDDSLQVSVKLLETLLAREKITDSHPSVTSVLLDITFSPMSKIVEVIDEKF